MEIKDGWLVCLRRCMPSNQRDAIGGRDLDLLDAIEAGFRRCSAGSIGEVHESAVAKIGQHPNHRVDRKNPKKKFHKSSTTPATPPSENGSATGGKPTDLP